MSEKIPAKDKMTTLPVLTDDEIDDAVKFINEKANETVYKGYIEIGEYILETFFNDDIQLASSRNPRKHESFNKLYERNDLAVHPNRLALMVRVASQERFLNDDDIDTGLLTYTHKTLLVKLDNGDEKKNLIKKCAEKQWSTRQLDEEIKTIIKKNSKHKEPSLFQVSKKYNRRMNGLLNTIETFKLEFGDDPFSKLSDKQRGLLKKQLKDFQKQSGVAEQKLKEMSESCESILQKLESEENSKTD